MDSARIRNNALIRSPQITRVGKHSYFSAHQSSSIPEKVDTPRPKSDQCHNSTASMSCFIELYLVP